MLAKRIIPCLDVRDGKVVKGVQFKEHQIVGDILERAEFYTASGADELVFYDITASCENRSVNREWIKWVAQTINIPFCVAGGIRNIIDAEAVLNAGADKISINTPALENPDLINVLSERFGRQCVVIGVDSLQVGDTYQVFQYTGDSKKMCASAWSTIKWIEEIQARGAGEIVLNCMNQDGMRKGYDIAQLVKARELSHVPLIASGGAGSAADFLNVFREANVDGALAASVFHSNTLSIPDLKQFLNMNKIEIRL